MAKRGDKAMQNVSVKKYFAQNEQKKLTPVEQYEIRIGAAQFVYSEVDKMLSRTTKSILKALRNSSTKR